MSIQVSQNSNAFQFNKRVAFTFAEIGFLLLFFFSFLLCTESEAFIAGPAVSMMPAISISSIALQKLKTDLCQILEKSGVVCEKPGSDSAISSDGAGKSSGDQQNVLANLDMDADKTSDSGAGIILSDSISSDFSKAPADNTDRIDNSISENTAQSDVFSRLRRKIELRGCRVKSPLALAILKLMGIFSDFLKEPASVKPLVTEKPQISDQQTAIAVAGAGPTVNEPAGNSQQKPSQSGTAVAVKPAVKPAAKPVAPLSGSGLRRIKGSEVTPDITANAKRILKENHSKPFGTEIPFESAGKRYVGRIERHYHPPGGALKPWGYHPGVSILAAE
ncbi:MAG: hypothetical protein CVV64_12510 [Candidatus Wallbacteria bacterium HGW-Wallbacteria-1]|jgi:hypothetical protein|uniref:Uncharacterized protein n=1 Tax=Candidatus Wallbacteria bacterium HGW-Wallbacteria-1 TaxID=2013854 RepID=A0A2N1PNC7_9BACT|nr:MAG: hypothetical protein CVV64_12510 [Candidatus Wallbacteria bacterium HGW-Wallbacteria-1]